MRKGWIAVALLMLAGAALVLLREPPGRDPAAERAPAVLVGARGVAAHAPAAARPSERPAAEPQALIPPAAHEAPVPSADPAARAAAAPAGSATLQVLLLDASRKPVAGAPVSVLDASPGARLGDPLVSLRTDDAGRAQGFIPAGMLRLEVKVPLIEHDLGAVASGETRAVTLLYPRPATLQGTLTAGGEPVPAASVSFGRFTGSESTRTDAAGRYTLRVMGGVPGTLRAQSPLGGLVVRRLQVQPGGTVTEDLQLGTGTLVGLVADRLTGEGVAGVTLQLMESTGPSVGAVVTSDELGRFTLGDVADGAWRLSLGGDPLSRTEPVAVTLPADAAQRLVIPVDRTASVAGVVRTAQGAPSSARHDVYLLLPGKREPQSGVGTGKDGAFRFERLDVGDYLLCVADVRVGHDHALRASEVEAQAWATSAVHLISGDRLRQDLVLPPRTP